MASSKNQDEMPRSAIPIFDGKNFAVWRLRIKALLVAKGILFALGQRPAEAKVEEAKKYDEAEPIARALIINALSDNQLMLVMSCNSCHEMWERLKALHGQATQASKLVLQQQFYELRQADEPVQSFIARADHIFSQLVGAGVTMSESSLVDRIVCGLDERYRSFVSVWMNLAPALHTKAELIARLGSEELMMGRNDNGSRAYIASTSKAKGKNKTNGPSEGKHKTCYFCDEEGHWVRDCPHKKKWLAEKKNSQPHSRDGTREVACT